MALKEFKGRMLPSAPLSTLTVTSLMPLQCGSFNCKTVRILVLPSGSVLLLMLATDFDLEIVENDCLRNSVLLEWSWREVPWRSSVLSPWRSSEWSWKETDSMLWALLEVIGSPWWLPHVAWHVVVVCRRWLFRLELSVIWPTSWLRNVWWHRRVALIGIVSSLLVMCSHTSQLKSWCIGLADQWFLVHPVWCHCTFHQCSSIGMLRLLECQQRPWTCFQGVSSHFPFWICQDVAIAWSLQCPGNLQCWHTIFLGECWMLPMWVWCDSAIPWMLSAGPVRASETWAVGIWAVLMPLCQK